MQLFVGNLKDLFSSRLQAKQDTELSRLTCIGTHTVKENVTFISILLI